MKRFIITESEKNNIREMYGMLKEQIKPAKPEKLSKDLGPLSQGVKINGLTYKLPQIKNESDLHNFVAGSDSSGLGESNELFKNCVVTSIDPKDKIFCEKFRFSKHKEREWPYDNKGDILLGIRLILSINEFIRINAMRGTTKPISFSSLKGSVEALKTSKDYQAAIKENIISGVNITTEQLTYILDLLIADFGSSSSKVMDYYKQQLSQRIV